MINTKNKNTNRKQIFLSALLAIIYTFAHVLGEDINTYNHILFYNSETYVKIITSSILFFIIIYSLFKLLLNRTNGTPVSIKSYQLKKIHWILLYSFLNIVGLIVLYGVYPGFACYDFNEQINQVQTGVYTAHHPLLHTLFMGKIITTIGEASGSYNFGGFCYCFLQMLIITSCFIWVLKNLYEMGMSTKSVIISTAFYGLLPTNIMFLLCTTKDSLFTAFFVCNLIYLKKSIAIGNENTETIGSDMIGFIITGILAGLLRNNMIYAYMAAIPFIIIIFRKKSIKICSAFIGIILAVFMINVALIQILSADNISTAEMLSVPAQQLARTVSEKGEDFLEPEELESLYNFIDKVGIDAYDGKIADPVKQEIKSNSASAVDFVKLWIKVGLKAPLIYIEATIENTFEAWYPNALIDGYCGVVGRYTTPTCYFSCDVEAPLFADNNIPAITSFFWNVSRNGLFQDMLLVKYLFSIGAYMWLLLFAFAYAILTKRYHNVVMLGLIILFCVTNLLGPIVLVRYYLILFWAAPVIWHSLFERCK
ncbi:MAG: DUF6020 family protein [Eubacteriales bacterium]